MRPSATVKPTTAAGRSAGPRTEPRGAVDDRRPRERREARARATAARAPPPARRPPAAGRAGRARRRRGRRRRGRAPRAARRSRRRARRRGRRRRPRAGGRGRDRACGAAPRTRRRARLASWRAAAGVRSTIGGDLLERHAEHVVQDEGEALGGGQRLEHDEQGEPDRVGQLGLVGRVGVLAGADDRLGQRRAHEVLAPRAARAQHVQAHAADDRRQPAAQVVDRLGVGAAEAQPRLLDGVVGLAQRAEHPVGDRAQVRPVLLELLGLVLVARPRSHPLVGVRHSSDEPTRGRCDRAPEAQTQETPCTRSKSTG